MEWFTVQKGVYLAFVLWLFFAGVYLPKVISSPIALSITTLVVGFALAWAVLLASPHAQPWDISVDTVFVIMGTGFAIIHSEILYRRKNGYWRWLGRRAA
jgi:hypothetical protein